MTLGQNGVLRHGHFSDFFSINWDRMDILGLIDFKIALYIKVTVNAGKTNLKSISNNLAKMAINWQKNRPDATLALEH